MQIENFQSYLLHEPVFWIVRSIFNIFMFGRIRWLSADYTASFFSKSLKNSLIFTLAFFGKHRPVKKTLQFCLVRGKKAVHSRPHSRFLRQWQRKEIEFKWLWSAPSTKSRACRAPAVISQPRIAKTLRIVWRRKSTIRSWRKWPYTKKLNKE